LSDDDDDGGGGGDDDDDDDDDDEPCEISEDPLGEPTRGTDEEETKVG
jgi:hypothetical protein